MGDKIAQSFEEMLGRGSITASIEYDFGRLADNVDSILDRAHGLSRQLRRVRRRPRGGAEGFGKKKPQERIPLIPIGLNQPPALPQTPGRARPGPAPTIELARGRE